ncbi:hypothetical protein SAMN05216188_107240 [Lentzea xinjiangensis]|uniref:Uncharacterized protein n=1 Tax=Lentzea xinjiangensis TaxID=402600 RepID=A0A1H9L3F5_9PSEU|nr:hypothetical protein [Lentzea xinjiangensis]SER06031.1 hypothetical protein SAMN05216188_107240 [Lentzea xinjiangensis]
MPARRSLRPKPQALSLSARLLLAAVPFLVACLFLWRLLNPVGSRDTRGFNPVFGWVLLALALAAVVYVLTAGFGGWAHRVNRAAKHLIEGAVAVTVVVLLLGGLVVPHVLDASLGARDLGGQGGVRLLGVLGLAAALTGGLLWLRARRRKRSADRG